MCLRGNWTKTPKFGANHISIEVEGVELYCNTVVSIVKLTSNKHHPAKHHIEVNVNHAWKATSIFKLRLKAENQTFAWPTRGLLSMFDLFWYLNRRWSVTVWEASSQHEQRWHLLKEGFVSPLTFLSPNGGVMPEPDEALPCSWNIATPLGGDPLHPKIWIAV